MKLTAAQRQTICRIWSEIDNEVDDISTERLFAMTCERARQLGMSIDDGDVTDALRSSEQAEPRKGKR